MGISEDAVLWNRIKYLCAKYILCRINTVIGLILIKCEKNVFCISCSFVYINVLIYVFYSVL